MENAFVEQLAPHGSCHITTAEVFAEGPPGCCRYTCDKVSRSSHAPAMRGIWVMGS